MFASPLATQAAVAGTLPLLNRHCGSYLSLISSSFWKLSAPQTSAVLLCGALHHDGQYLQDEALLTTYM